MAAYPAHLEYYPIVAAPKKVPRIQALARASAIIDVIADAGEDGVGLSNISKITGLNKTTAFNLLASLVTLRFVEQLEISRKYILGLRNLELGRIVQRRMHIPTLARSMLIDLCKKTNETINLGLPDVLDLWVADSFKGAKLMHATAAVGGRWPYHSTALGKAFMMRWDSPRRRNIYDTCGLPQMTPDTITDIDALEMQLTRFRAQGYVLDLEENEIGINGIATPVVDGLGKVAAAISISGPAGRLTKDIMEQFAPDLIAAAKLVTAAIGGQSHNE